MSVIRLLSGAKRTTLESKPERGPGGDPLRAGARRAAPPAPWATQLGQRARDLGIVSFAHLAREGRMTVTIGRRELLAAFGGAAVAWPLAARAQQPDRMRRIGVLMNTAVDDPEGQASIAAFHQGLQEWGWTLGR